MPVNLTDRRTLHALLRSHGIRPRRHWGQNFLVSRAIVNRIVDAANVGPNDTVLEIGGGVGTLTVALAQRAKRVIVVERDPSLCAILKEITARHGNVQLRCSDARHIPIYQLPSTNYRLVANLPYSVGTAVLRQLLESDRPPKAAIVMLQRDVAERVVAQPPNAHLLSVTMQYLAEPKLLFRVPKTASWPQPEVESAVVLLVPRTQTGDQKTKKQRDKEKTEFMATVRKGFAHPRKYVLNNLAADTNQRRLLAETCGIKATARPQELTLAQWRCLSASSAP